MSQAVAILGRQPVLGRAELESLFGADKLTPVGDIAILIDHEVREVPFARLGGTVKLTKLLTFIESTDWKKIEDHLVNNLPKHLHYFPEGKLTIGLSAYGLSASPERMNATALTLKKIIKQAGRPARVVPNREKELNTAQVLHNKLTDPSGLELVFIRDGDRTVMTQTIALQDIEAYAARDQARPKRDAKVGMLPPKLAQTIINLARPQKKSEIEDILDPFCGTGVILQEALLMGFVVAGTDIDERMAEYSRANIEWFCQKWMLVGAIFSVGQADATNYLWPNKFDAIACETYLGRPFSAEPKPEVLNEVIRDVDTIHKKFLKNVARQTKPGFRMCIAVPAWKTRNGFRHLPCLDHLTDMGYTRLSFVHARNEELIYHRENQIVGRELVTLIRK